MKERRDGRMKGEEKRGTDFDDWLDMGINKKRSSIHL